jgi:hypothetical protein
MTEIKWRVLPDARPLCRKSIVIQITSHKCIENHQCQIDAKVIVKIRLESVGDWLMINRLDNKSKPHGYHGLIRVILVSYVILLASCGGGGGGGSGSNVGNSGWITIQSSGITVDEGGVATTNLRGEAFVADETYVGHRCVGFACIFGWYDNSYPGVDVTWVNHTTSEHGSATSGYGTATSWDHVWAASVPLVLGKNRIQVTASDPAGNSGTDSITVEYQPKAPDDLQANSGDSEITLFWSPVPEATSYRLYWSFTPDDVISMGTRIDLESTSYVHGNLNNGTTYYYVVTSRYLTSESSPSPVISATSGVPPRPSNLSANPIQTDVELSWDDVPLADTYTLYWDNEPGVTKQTGTPDFGVISPYLHTNLSGLPYYYVVTASNGYGESIHSEEVVAFPPIPPPAPANLGATQRYIDHQAVVDLFWQPIPGVDSYNVLRSWVGSARLPDPEDCDGLPWAYADEWEIVGTSTEGNFVDWTVRSGFGYMIAVYRYSVAATNAFGSSPQSDWIPVCIPAEQ